MPDAHAPVKCVAMMGAVEVVARAPFPSNVTLGASVQLRAVRRTASVKSAVTMDVAEIAVFAPKMRSAQTACALGLVSRTVWRRHVVTMVVGGVAEPVPLT